MIDRLTLYYAVTINNTQFSCAKGIGRFWLVSSYHVPNVNQRMDNLLCNALCMSWAISCTLQGTNCIQKYAFFVKLTRTCVSLQQMKQYFYPLISTGKHISLNYFLSKITVKRDFSRRKEFYGVIFVFCNWDCYTLHSIVDAEAFCFSNWKRNGPYFEKRTISTAQHLERYSFGVFLSSIWFLEGFKRKNDWEDGEVISASTVGFFLVQTFSIAIMVCYFPCRTGLLRQPLRSPCQVIMWTGIPLLVCTLDSLTPESLREKLYEPSFSGC